jgi:hypothetical protein
MRTVLVVAVLAACGPDVDGHHHDAGLRDTATADVSYSQCSAAAGTAMITLDTAGTQTHFDRLDAGGTLNTGPLTGVAGPSMFAMLLVTNTDPLSQQEAGCCEYKDSTCCHATGLVIETQVLDYGAEVGDHIVQAGAFDASFSLSGTLTITHFEHPYDHLPGRIAGSVSVISDVRTISGSFDNAFCPAILSATI